jgi:myo-inositol-1(or 4)-monophosphatase
MSEYLEVCEKAVRRGGALLVERIGKVAVREKGRADLVTEADIASQELVRSTLRESFPDHSLMSEEDPIGGAAATPTEYRWILDPLDGTTNYVHGVPHFAVSLALERRGELLVGAVYDPMADECFIAVRGGGAFLNGKPIRTSGIAKLSEALVAVGFPTVVQRDSPDLLLFNEAVMRCQAMRRTGSAALNMAYVAAGRFDASWACGTKLWDVAAGILLIREAQGAVTSLATVAGVLGEVPTMAAASDPLLSELLAVAGLVSIRPRGFISGTLPFA